MNSRSALLAIGLIFSLALPEAALAANLKSPLGQTCITSGYGKRNTGIRGASRNHLACDYRAGCGTKVTAAAAGRVTRARWTGGYGYRVEITHNDGTKTTYSHLQKGSLPREGSRVAQGQQIARSGRSSSIRGLACHLHFEVIKNGRKVNPGNYLNIPRCGGRRSSSGGRTLRP